MSTGSQVCQFKTAVMVHHWAQNREKSFRNYTNYNATVAVLTCFAIKNHNTPQTGKLIDQNHYFYWAISTKSILSMSVGDWKLVESKKNKRNLR